MIFSWIKSFWSSFPCSTHIVFNISYRNEVLNAEHRASDLQHDLRLLEKLSSDALRAMADTQREMSQVQEDIARMYANVCERNHQTPSRIMTLEHIRGSTTKNGDKKNSVSLQTSTELVYYIIRKYLTYRTLLGNFL